MLITDGPRSVTACNSLRTGHARRAHARHPRSPPTLPTLGVIGPRWLEIAGRVVTGIPAHSRSDELFVAQRLPHTYGFPRLDLQPTAAGSGVEVSATLTIGIVFCGRQCPGAHNVVAGIRR